MVKLLKVPAATAVRTVELNKALQPLTDVLDYIRVQVFVSLNGRLLGSVCIANHRQPIGVTRLRDAIVNGLSFRFLETVLAQHCILPPRVPMSLPADVSVSIVVATCDRPDDLRDCLRCLNNQVTPRPVEIIVVDNNPASGLTPPILAQFPGFVLVSEQRRGLAYARNKGIITSTGDIVIATDDDVRMPPDWLEKLVSPFVRPDVMVVTGNVLPLELETPPQHLFEVYGGLGRGFEPREGNGEWFRRFRSAVPTWVLGGTANAAFRTAIFAHSKIGLFDEALGAGTPTGCSEDTYLFYKVLKAGYTVVYEPSAYVWHKHRRDMPGLQRQIYNYSKGHVAYHLTTLIRDRDMRALIRLGVRLPQVYVRRAVERLRKRSSYPLWLIIIEIIGNLAGPFALWNSRRRVRREGSSDLYVPASERPAVTQQHIFA